MTDYEEIKGYEEGIKVLQDAISKVRNKPKTIKRGDFIRCTNSVEWAYSKGDRMWVDTVNPSHILARSEDPSKRANYVFWVTNSDWVKE